MFVKISTLVLGLIQYTIVNSYEVTESNSDLYEIEGKVFPQESLVPNPNWVVDTKVFTKGGYHMGFLR